MIVREYDDLLGLQRFTSRGLAALQRATCQPILIVLWEPIELPQRDENDSEAL